MKEEELRHLIQLMKKNDGKAFEEFFNILYPRFYRYAFLYLKSDLVTEEVVSDVFLKLWNVRDRLNEIQQLEFYLFRAVKNQALTYIKRNAIRPEEITEFVESNLVEYKQPENLLIQEEFSKTIERAVSELPEKCQAIFRMVREDGLSYKQVAVLLQISPKTVENQMNKSLKRLRQAVEDYYGTSDMGKKLRMFFLFF